MFVQIEIKENQHNGRDTHIRQIKIFSPREKESINDTYPIFKTPEMAMFETLR